MACCCGGGPAACRPGCVGPVALRLSLSLGGFIFRFPDSFPPITDEDWKPIFNTSYILDPVLVTSGSIQYEYNTPNISIGVTWFCRTSSRDCRGFAVGGPSSLCIGMAYRQNPAGSFSPPNPGAFLAMQDTQFPGAINILDYCNGTPFNPISLNALWVAANSGATTEAWGVSGTVSIA